MDERTVIFRTFQHNRSQWKRGDAADMICFD